MLHTTGWVSFSDYFDENSVLVYSVLQLKRSARLILFEVSKRFIKFIFQALKGNFTFEILDVKIYSLKQKVKH